MRGKSVLQRHPTAAFFTLVIGWSYLFWSFLFQALPLEAGEGPTLLHILLGGLGGSPSLMALLFSYWIGGKQELRELLSRIKRWRIHPSRYGAALLLFPAINAVVYLLYGQLGGKVYPLEMSSIGIGLAAGSMSALLEEFGWRGYALPALQKRHPVLVSGLITGLGWGIWHLGLNIQVMAADSSYASLLLSAWGPAGLTAASVLMAWIYANSQGSLLLMILAHFSLTGSFFAFGPPASYPSAEFLRFHLITIAVLWFFAGAVLVVSRARTTLRSYPLN